MVYKYVKKRANRDYIEILLIYAMNGCNEGRAYH